MNILSRIFRKEEPLVIPKAPPPLHPGAHLEFAYLCLEHGHINDGVTQGRCKTCQSQSVLYLKEIVEHQQHKAKQRLALVKKMKEAGYRNDLNTLTAPEPKPAA